jgi:uncharacterized membrane protein YedE/YeeE
MKYISILVIGVFFGIVLTKSEVISWYRIQEMFRFESFHMYGVIGAAVVLGAIFVALSKGRKWHAIGGKDLQLINYPKGWKKYLIGGTIFGLGWAMTGACPGPLFILVGNGFSIMLIAILGALIGSFVHGLVSKKLPK